MSQEHTWRTELRSMLKLAWPVVLAELGWMLQGVVDVIMVGRLGPVAIGAVALGNALYYAPSLFGLGIMLGLDTVISHAYGRRDHEACHRWLAQGVYIALIAAPLLMLIVFGIGFGIPHFGIAPELVRPTTVYLRILLLGTLPLLLYAASRRYLQAVGEVRVITLTFVGANLLNWGGNWVLINGKLGLPALGVAGSSISTVLSRVLMAVTLFGFAWRYEKQRGHPLFAHWARPVLREMRELLRLGLPAAGQLVLEIAAFGLATVFAGKISPVALAAHQIVLNYAALAFMVPLGISAAAAIAVGHALGAGDPRRARLSGLLALLIGATFMLLMAILFFAIPQPLIALYTHDPAVMAAGRPLFMLAAAFAVFDGIQIIAGGALRGMGKTRIAMWANLVGYWVVGVPLGAALCFHWNFGVAGLWIGLTTALILISVVLLFAWRKQAAALLPVKAA
jgi:MATE family multidrug resistance protein